MEVFWGAEPPYNPQRDIDRAEQIGQALKELNLPKDFTLIEVACGTGGVVAHLQNMFPTAQMQGIDIASQWNWKDFKVKLEQKPLQLLFDEPQKYDVVVMLNSYRNWGGEAKNQFDKWLKEKAQYFVTSGVKLDYESKRIGMDFKDNHMDLFYIK